MASLKWFALAAMLAVTVTAAAAAGQREKAPEKGSKEAVEAEAVQMVAECKLTAEQQATLKEKVKAKTDALEEWLKANGEKLKAAQDAAKAARSGADAAAKKKAGDDLKALEAARDQALAQADTAVLAVLTAQQKEAWDGFKLYQTTIARYKKANLAEEQIAKIKAVCAAGAKELASVEGDDRKAKQAKSAVPLKLRFAIEEAILTAEQRATLPPPKAGPGKAGAAQPAAAQPAAEK
jgi:Spy/CpxP family protein refolding chaperone